MLAQESDLAPFFGDLSQCEKLYEIKLPLVSKAKLLQVGIFFFIHLFAREILLIKKLEIKETKTT